MNARMGIRERSGRERGEVYTGKSNKLKGGGVIIRERLGGGKSR